MTKWEQEDKRTNQAEENKTMINWMIQDKTTKRVEEDEIIKLA